MSYSAEANGSLFIKKANIKNALDDLGYSVDNIDNLTEDNIVEMFEEEGFRMIFDQEGNIVKTIFPYDYFDSDEVLEFLESIAPYVEDGSCISFEGEDGDCWEYEFESGCVSGGPHDW